MPKIGEKVNNLCFFRIGYRIMDGRHVLLESNSAANQFESILSVSSTVISHFYGPIEARMQNHSICLFV